MPFLTVPVLKNSYSGALLQAVPPSASDIIVPDASEQAKGDIVQVFEASGLVEADAAAWPHCTRWHRELTKLYIAIEIAKQNQVGDLPPLTAELTRILERMTEDADGYIEDNFDLGDEDSSIGTTTLAAACDTAFAPDAFPFHKDWPVCRTGDEVETTSTSDSGGGTGEFVQPGVARQTLTADLVLTTDDEPIQHLDPGGADRLVSLPATDTLAAGFSMRFKHVGDANIITIQTETPAAVITLDADEWADVVWDGTDWEAY